MTSNSAKNVLIIEDNFFMAQLLSEKIAHQGFTPAHEPDGEVGLAEIEKKVPDLLLVDLPLAGKVEGWSMLEQLHKKYPNLPVVILFNAASDDDIARVSQLQAARYLIKGDVNADAIVAAVREVLLGPEAPAVPAPQSDTKPTEPAKSDQLSKASGLEDLTMMADRAVVLRDKVAEMLKLPEAEVSIIELVDDMMTYAFVTRASDVHLEPFEEKVIARMRIDGILNDVFTFPKNLHSGIITRIKVLGGMRTDEHQAAQDGRFRMSITEPNKQFDVRVSIVPTYYGENSVLRLLAEQTAINSLDDLAFTDRDRKRIRNAVKTPYGMILATGPTGSGKTTTLYTILKELNTREVSVITIEDPIEYSLEGVDQIQVNARTSLTFAAGLRSILRQDPNIIMVGEIRDEETASIAVNAALTGHKLLSTIHTNDAATTLPRLLDMGIEPFLVASTVNVAIGQRLVRMICPHCKVPRRITEGEFDSLKEYIPV